MSYDSSGVNAEMITPGSDQAVTAFISRPGQSIFVITNDSRHFIITNTCNRLTQSVNEPFTFLIVFDLNSV